MASSWRNEFARSQFRIGEEARIQGMEVVAVSEEARPAVDIMTAPKQSIEKAKAERQGMIKAGKGKKTEPAESDAKNDVGKAKATAAGKRA